MHPQFTILDPEIGNGHVPIPVECEVWSEWISRTMPQDRRVGGDMIGTIYLSTVFLGLDHSFVDGPPMYFETMAFDKADERPWAGLEEGDFFERYATWEAAELGHREKLERLKQMVQL
jgi:hypothetical protein